MTSFMVSEMGLEPTQISPYAPETYVSTIPPLRRINFYSIFTVHDTSKVVDVLRTLSQNVTFSHFLFGRVPLRRINFLFNFFEEFISN